MKHLEKTVGTGRARKRGWAGVGSLLVGAARLSMSFLLSC